MHRVDAAAGRLGFVPVRVLLPRDRPAQAGIQSCSAIPDEGEGRTGARGSRRAAAAGGINARRAPRVKPRSCATSPAASAAGGRSPGTSLSGTRRQPRRWRRNGTRTRSAWVWADASRARTSGGGTERGTTGEPPTRSLKQAKLQPSDLERACGPSARAVVASTGCQPVLTRARDASGLPHRSGRGAVAAVLPPAVPPDTEVHVTTGAFGPCRASRNRRGNESRTLGGEWSGENRSASDGKRPPAGRPRGAGARERSPLVRWSAGTTTPRRPGVPHADTLAGHPGRPARPIAAHTTRNDLPPARRIRRSCGRPGGDRVGGIPPGLPSSSRSVSCADLRIFDRRRAHDVPPGERTVVRWRASDLGPSARPGQRDVLPTPRTAAPSTGTATWSARGRTFFTERREGRLRSACEVCDRPGRPERAATPLRLRRCPRDPDHLRRP